MSNQGIAQSKIDREFSVDFGGDFRKCGFGEQGNL